MEELEKHPDLEMVNFQDDTFMSHDEDFLREFCEESHRRVGKPFIGRAIPTYVTRDKLRSLKEAGMAWITMGLQSGSDHVCKEIVVGTAGRLARLLLVLAYAYLLLLLIGLVCRDTMSEAHWASAATKTRDQACGFTIGRQMQNRAKWRLKTLLAAFARMLTEWVKENWG